MYADQIGGVDMWPFWGMVNDVFHLYVFPEMQYLVAVYYRL